MLQVCAYVMWDCICNTLSSYCHHNWLLNSVIVASYQTDGFLGMIALLPDLHESVSDREHVQVNDAVSGYNSSLVNSSHSVCGYSEMRDFNSPLLFFGYLFLRWERTEEHMEGIESVSLRI